jgi:RHS repeat-associated protein
MAVAADGSIWFTEWSASKIGRIDPTTHQVYEYSLPTASSKPYGITAGPDGNIWFTEYAGNKIGKLVPCSTLPCTPSITEYAIPTSNSSPVDITAGPDGNLWFDESSAGKIGKITTASSPTISEYAIPTSSGASASPRGIVAGPDGALWFGDVGQNAIGRITTGSSPSITEFPLPTAGADPLTITSGPDGALWFTEYNTNQIGRITTAGAVTEYKVPTGSSRPLGIALGGDGNLWFTEYTSGKIASLNPGQASPGTTQGITETSTPTSSSGPVGVIAGPDGNVWFSEYGASKLASIALNTYTLTDVDGTTRTFVPASAGQYVPSEDTSPTSGSGAVTWTSTFQTVPGPGGSATPVVEPVSTATTAPGATCAATPAQQRQLTQHGCRTLTYTYGSSATAQADCPIGWGDYPGRLTAVAYSTYEEAPPNPGYKTVTVARYCYDSAGFLRAEFDPRVCDSIGGACTELPTEYGYNESNDLITSITPPGLNGWTINYETISGDSNPGRLFSVSQAQDSSDGPGGTATYTMAYHVPVSGTGAPYAMDSPDVSAWAQTDNPTDATAIFPADEVPASPPADYNRATIYYIDSNGNTVNVAQPGGRIATTEYYRTGNDVGDLRRELTPADRAAALAAGPNSASEATLLDTQYTYTSDGVNVATMTGPQHMIQLANGTQELARQVTTNTYDQGNPGCNNCLTGLLTTQTVGTDQGQDIRTTTYSYTGQSNLGWQLGEPTSSTVDPGGLNLTSTTLYDATTGEVTEIRRPANPNGGDGHANQTVYYTTAANAQAANCGNAADWEGQVCQTQPAAQPGTSGLPSLPVTTYSYNMWGEITTDQDVVTDASGVQDTRTVSNSYDSVGREIGTSITAQNAGGGNVGQPMPTISYGYDPRTGLPTTQTSGDGQTLTTAYDALGRVTSYIDADGNTSSYTYDIDGRVTSATDGKGTQTPSYDPTTGDETSLQDSGVGKFSATYNADGNMISETYPNGMTVSYSYDETGSPTSLTYSAPSSCTTNCSWYTDSVVPSIQGQSLYDQSTLGNRNYTYDSASHLTEVQDSPVGQGCTIRVYTYDADSNRVGLVTRNPNQDGSCDTTPGDGTTQTHTYDSADRITDPGVTYDAWGNITSLPPADAGGSQLASTYYADDTIYTQDQNGQTTTYNLDPVDRVRGRLSVGGASSDEIDHYSNAGDSPTWIDTGNGTWQRYVPGIDGNLAATETSSGSSTLRISDLHGDTVGTVGNSPSATPALSQNTDEFGVPYGGRTPQRYDYLGSSQRATALPSGVIDMGAREYIPQLGRFEQTDPVPGGSANAYDYATQDPVNSSDPSGAWEIGGSGGGGVGVLCNLRGTDYPHFSQTAWRRRVSEVIWQTTFSCDWGVWTPAAFISGGVPARVTNVWWHMSLYRHGSRINDDTWTFGFLSGNPLTETITGPCVAGSSYQGWASAHFKYPPGVTDIRNGTSYGGGGGWGTPNTVTTCGTPGPIQ